MRRIDRHRIVNGLTGITLLALSSCALGPNYKRPAVAAPAVFRGQEGAAEQASIADLPWWEVFNDPALASLIKDALANNYDLLVAMQRIEQARAVGVQVRSEFFPQLGYEGDTSHGKNAIGDRVASTAGKTVNAFAGLLNASWEIDLWGRIRRADEAARAQILANEEARRGVMLSLVSDVAQAYFELLELDLQLEIARRTTESFRDSLDIFRRRLEGGVASRLETARASASLALSAATVPNLERLIVFKENQINLLLGRTPAPVTRGAALTAQRLPPEVPAGIPSDLLERRPDIRQSEQQIVAANARIGVAIADFFPRLDLTGLFGFASPELSAITAGRNRVWSAAASLAGPLFQGGRLVGQYQQFKSEWEEARIRYEQTALNAFHEVSNALVSRQKLTEVRAQQARAVADLQESVSVSTQRYLAGFSSYFEVLEAQQQLFPAENALAQTQLDQLVVIVQLYRALGGGWKLADAEWTAAPQ
ncbi:MAG TPA: efflux transporter outer membrane subunit [Candidatus Binatia bacterium]|nr:efflux transporter outer membrane subunit [Candidatus Binatia bacterium]